MRSRSWLKAPLAIDFGKGRVDGAAWNHGGDAGALDEAAAPLGPRQVSPSSSTPTTSTTPLLNASLGSGPGPFPRTKFGTPTPSWRLKQSGTSGLERRGRHQLEDHVVPARRRHWLLGPARRLGDLAREAVQGYEVGEHAWAVLGEEKESANQAARVACSRSSCRTRRRGYVSRRASPLPTAHRSHSTAPGSAAAFTGPSRISQRSASTVRRLKSPRLS